MLTVRLADEDDAPEILAVQRLAFQAMAFRLQRPGFPPLAEELDDLVRDFSLSIIFKAVWAGRLVGSVRGTVQGDVCHVRRMSVDPGFHGRGVGSALLAHVEAGAGPVSRFELSTSTQNAEAIRLYERRGYVATRTEADSPAGPMVHMERVNRAGRI